MNTRLLAILFACAMLGGCATYDYTSGSAPGGYYHGRPSVEYYGPYGGGYAYGYPSYGSYLYGSYGYGSRYYRSPYSGYHPYYHPYYRPYQRPYQRPHYPTQRPRPPRDEQHDHANLGDRPPPWRAPDGRRMETGSVMVPPTARVAPSASGQPGRQVPPSPIAPPQLGQSPPPPPQADPPPAPRRQTGSPWRQPSQAPTPEARRDSIEHLPREVE